MTNPLNLVAKRSVCVILVDGLGLHNLKGAAAHAGFLNSVQSEAAMCWFPATTATSLTSFATSSNPSTNGFLGYQVFNEATQAPMNLLSGWTNFEAGSSYQELPTIAEQATESNVAFHTIAPAAYERSGFTGATMRGSFFHGLNNISDRFLKAKQLLKDSEAKVVYLYIPELDQIAHAKGFSSIEWLNELEAIDAQVRVLSADLPKFSGIVVTADHGVVDVEKANHI
ncbi:MAG: alkaline phosphatase family protein, partial [Actinomycetes bacterium]